MGSSATQTHDKIKKQTIFPVAAALGHSVSQKAVGDIANKKLCQSNTNVAKSTNRSQ